MIRANLKQINLGWIFDLNPIYSVNIAFLKLWMNYKSLDEANSCCDYECHL